MSSVNGRDVVVAKEDCLVVLADLQEGLVQVGRTNEECRLRATVATLCRLATALSMPTFASVVPLGSGATVISEVSDNARSLVTVARPGPQIFRHDESVAAIERFQAKTLVFAGVASEAAVLHGALGARARGKNALVLVDACSGISTRTEEAAFRQMHDAGVVTTSLLSFATALVDHFATEDGKAVFEAVMQIVSADAK